MAGIVSIRESLAELDQAHRQRGDRGSQRGSDRHRREWQPGGAVQPFDGDALLQGARDLLSAPPLPPVTMPDSLRAMQQATLALYEQLA